MARRKTATRKSTQTRQSTQVLQEIFNGQYPIGTAITGVKAVPELEQVLSPDEVNGLPYGRRFFNAIRKDLTLSHPRGFALHNEEVFEAVCRLEQDRTTKGTFNGLSTDSKKLLKLAGFLHDIGKALEQARHPILGWHILTDLSSVASSDRIAKDRLLRDLTACDITEAPEFFRNLARLIRDHDKFGVLSTGEASYVILGSIVDYGMVERSVEQLRLTWLLNTADIAGTLTARPSNLTTQRLKDLVVRSNEANRSTRLYIKAGCDDLPGLDSWWFTL